MVGSYDSNAGSALRGEGGTGPTEAGTADGQEQASAAREDTFFLPHDYPGAADLQPGDTLQLRVVGKDAQGQCEVEVVPPDEKPNAAMADGGKKPMMEDMEESLK